MRFINISRDLIYLIPFSVILVIKLFSSLRQVIDYQKLGKVLLVIAKVEAYESKGSLMLMFYSFLLADWLYRYFRYDFVHLLLLILILIGSSDIIFVRFYLSRLPKKVGERGIVCHQQVVSWRKVASYWVEELNDKAFIVHFTRKRRLLFDNEFKIVVPRDEIQELGEILYDLEIPVTVEN